MLIVKGVLVSDELIDNYFCCDLEKCQGLCCVEGDVGAPLEPLEVGELEDYFPTFKKYMTNEGVAKVEKGNTFDYDMEGNFVTPLLENEACAFVYYEDGIAKCVIEKAFLNGEIDFKKPVSCHLYPIRINILPDYEALNYHHWFVCQHACDKGKKLKLPVYRFLKEPLIRKYGNEWFEELEKAVKNRKN
jgi:hypothetical protein